MVPIYHIDPSCTRFYYLLGFHQFILYKQFVGHTYLYILYHYIFKAKVIETITYITKAMENILFESLIVDSIVGKMSRIQYQLQRSKFIYHRCRISKNNYTTRCSDSS